MNLSHLTAIIKRPKKRVGRGHGSGKVKTSGRGTKGQNARGHMPPGFEGGQLSLIKRLPLLRGKSKNQHVGVKAYPVGVLTLNALSAGTKVTLETLKKYHMIDESVSLVKVLGAGKIEKKLTVCVSCSQSARQAIEKAGGTVEA